MVKSSDTGGVKPMSIAGRMVRERERLIGMTDEERKWRAQWLKDQVLTEREPVYVKEYHESLTNPIRRAYRTPLNVLLWRPLVPILGNQNAFFVRLISGKLLMGIAAVYLGVYYFKYNQNDWTRKGGWRVTHARKIVVPGDPGYPKLSDRSAPNDYASRGFKQCPI